MIMIFEFCLGADVTTKFSKKFMLQLTFIRKKI